MEKVKIESKQIILDIPSICAQFCTKIPILLWKIAILRKAKSLAKIAQKNASASLKEMNEIIDVETK